MKTYIKRLLSLLAGFILIAGCGGATSGTAADNADGDTRTVTGNLASGSGAGLVKGLHADDCEADMVIATTTSGETSSADVEEDCSFSLSLSVGQSYVIGLALDDEFIATLIFDSGISGYTTSVLPLSAGEILDLGIITIFGDLATPENEPLGECDNDGDGEDDLEDEDDDNDGTEDEMEEDCDLDGSLDDYDEDEDDCEEDEEGEDEARVLEVKPRNDPHPGEGEDTIDLEREIKARLSCEVDRDTVNTDTFYIVSEDGMDIIACEYEFSRSGSSGNRIECDHDDQDFLPDTVYIATVDGVMCADGRSVEARSWEWLTESEDDDEGCFEDEFDEEDELEDEEDDDDDDEGEDEEGDEDAEDEEDEDD